MFPNFPNWLAIPCFVLLGAVFIMLVYHFLLYLQYRERVILKYCLYLLAIGLYLLADMNTRIDRVARNALLADAFNFITILTYAGFIIETIPVSKSRYRRLYNTWRLISWTTLLYVTFCLLLFIRGIGGFENTVNVMNNIFRVVLVVVGVGASWILVPLMKGRFLQWIKWGAVSYLFFMAVVVYVILVKNSGLLFGLSPMHYVYIGTLSDVIIFSVAMSFRIKELVIKVTEIRNRLSRDLHDDIGASLSSIQLYSSVAERALDENTGKAKDILRQIRKSTTKVMEDMGDIVWAMNAREKEGAGFANRIKNYGYELLSHKNIKCRYLIDEQAEQKLFTPESRKNILLVVKEALNNIAKYSDASHAEVYMGIEKNDFIISVSDNGKGFSVKDTTGGNGLKNIRQRAVELGGTAELFSTPGNGTSIKCRIPLTNISDN